MEQDTLMAFIMLENNTMKDKNKIYKPRMPNDMDLGTKAFKDTRYDDEEQSVRCFNTDCNSWVLESELDKDGLCPSCSSPEGEIEDEDWSIE